MTRSENMARIKRSRTRPEELLRKALRSLGLRYRVDAKTPGGRADLVFRSKRFAIFIDGCFWHGCPDHYVRPRSSAPFWAEKLLENVRRDQRQAETLTREGWRFCRVWEHEIAEDIQKAAARAVACLNRHTRSCRNDWRVVAVEVSSSTQLETRHLECLSSRRQRTEQSRRYTAKTGRVMRRVVPTPEGRRRPPQSE